MKTNIALIVAVALTGFLCSCSSTQTRIDSDPVTYAKSSKEIQAKIRAAEVDIGFTREQVRLALGDPTGVTTRTTDKGTNEVWNYHETGPRFGFGVGVGGGNVRGGVGVGTGERSDEPKIRLIFDKDRVVSVERQTKS